MSEKFSPSPYFPVQAALFEATLAILALLCGWMMCLSPMQTLRVTPSALGLGLLAVLPLVGMLAVSRNIAWQPIREVRRVLDDVVVPMFRNCTWAELATISFLAGVGEELLFRGLIQESLAQWTGSFLPHTHRAAMVGDWIAIVLVAILFGMLHALNAGYAVLAALMGLYLGWIWLATGNLAVPIVAHAVYDFVALAYLVRFRPAPADATSQA